MASIKGPKSALSDFIEEHGIKINYLDKRNSEDVMPTIDRKRKLVKKTNKKIKPFEFSSKDLHNVSLQNILISRILKNINSFTLNDSHLEMISSYLSKHRMFNVFYFNSLVNLCKNKLIIYDCSNIKDEEFIISNHNLTCLELYQCGQLTNSTLNDILKQQNNLKELRITGGYLITEILLPSKLYILDLSNCNRLSNSIIVEINKKYKKLDELKLSYCYKITDDVKLKTSVKRLFVEETRISENFYLKKEIQSLSFKNCCLINSLDKNYNNLEYLNLANITTINNIKIGNKLKSLDISKCYSLKKWFFENIYKLINLEYLNISYLDFDSYDFLHKLNSIKELDISWCSNITDEIVISLMEKTKIEKIYVFGCFNLTDITAKFSYKYKDTVTIVGNHAETRYLIQNS